MNKTPDKNNEQGQEGLGEAPGTVQKSKGLDLKTLANRIEVKVGAAAAILILIVGILFGTHIVCIHEWSSATCETPVTCSVCGATKGKAKGHLYLDASCVRPKKCRRCGKKVGKALGHDYSEATCTEPETCKRCGWTSGEALGHEVDSWTVAKEASCSEPGTREGACSRCGETVTESIAKLEHTPGEWKVTKDFSVTSWGTVTPGTESQACTVCGAVINTRDYTTTLTVSQKNALAKAGSYLDYTAFSYSSLIDQLEYEGFSTEDATFAVDHCGADWMVQAEKKAQQYMDYTSFSRSGLIGQLEFEGFTSEQAAHGADSVGL